MAIQFSKTGIKKLSTTPNETRSWSIALVLFAFLLNIDTIRYGFTFDDPLVVSQNKFVAEGWSSLGTIFKTANLEGYNGQKESNYRPFSIGQFAIERSIFGTGPAGFHFMHLLFYAIVGWLVFRFLMVILKAYPVWIPVAVTALFIAHPLHTEVVANLKSRDEIMALIGILSTLLILLKDHTPDFKYILLIFATACVAFFSKESAFALVVVAPLTVYYFNPKGLKSRLKHLMAIGLAAGLYLIMRQFIAEVPAPNFHLEDNALFAFEYPERIMAGMALIAHNAWLFLFPFKLRADYSYDQLHLTGWTDIWSYAGLLILAMALYNMIKGLKSKSIAGYAWTFSALFYAITSNIFIMTGATLAERFMFVPSLGLLILVGLFISDLYSKQRISKGQAIMILSLVTVIYSIRTLIRNTDWYDNAKIVEITSKDCPSSIRALTKQARNKFEEAMRVNQPEGRIQLFSQSLNNLNSSLAIYDGYALTHFIYGMVERELKNYKQAITSFNKAIALKPDDGSFDFQLGQTYILDNEDLQALASFQRAEGKGVRNIALYDEWAKLYLKKNQYVAAIEVYKKLKAIKSAEKYALGQITKIYRDQLQDIENAMLYNEELRKVIESERKK